MHTVCGMPSTKWTIAILGLLCLWSSIQATKIQGITEKNAFRNKDIIFDFEPLKNNTLVYALCNPDIKKRLDCSIVLKSFPTAKKVYKKTCEVDYKPKENILITDKFQLRSLYDNQVILMWVEHSSDENNVGWRTIQRELVYRVIDMSSCKSMEHRFAYDSSLSSRQGVNNFYVVPYEDSFDLFFRNGSLCGEYMCGQTRSKSGRIINGPVASYLPIDFFKEPTLMYPLKPMSSALGHFVLSSEFHLVSSSYGGIKYLTDFPGNNQGYAVSSNNDLLGFCWLSQDNPKEINCTQFDTRGERVSSEQIKLIEKESNSDYALDQWVAMSNLKNGGMLLLTSKKDDDNWRTEFTDKAKFYAYRIVKNAEGQNTVELLTEFSGVDCNYVRDIKMEIQERDNGDVCFTIACHVKQNNEGYSYVNLLAKCII